MISARFVGCDRGGGGVNDGISSYAYGRYTTTSCAKQEADTGATVNDAELGATVNDVDTWLYIPYDN